MPQFIEVGKSHTLISNAFQRKCGKMDRDLSLGLDRLILPFLLINGAIFVAISVLILERIKKAIYPEQELEHYKLNGKEKRLLKLLEETMRLSKGKKALKNLLYDKLRTE